MYRVKKSNFCGLFLLCALLFVKNVCASERPKKKNILETTAFRQLSPIAQQSQITNITMKLLKNAMMKNSAENNPNRTKFFFSSVPVGIDSNGTTAIEWADWNSLVIEKRNQENNQAEDVDKFKMWFAGKLKKVPLLVAISPNGKIFAIPSEGGSTSFFETDDVIKALEKLPHSYNFGYINGREAQLSTPHADFVKISQNQKLVLLLDSSNGKICLFDRDKGDAFSRNIPSKFKPFVNQDCSKVILKYDDRLLMYNLNSEDQDPFASHAIISISVTDMVVDTSFKNILAWKNDLDKQENQLFLLSGIDSDTTTKYSININWPVASAAFNKNNSLIAIGGEKGLVLGKGERDLKRYPGLTGSLVAFSHNNEMLALYNSKEEKLTCYSVEQLLNNQSMPAEPIFTQKIKIGKKELLKELRFSNDDRTIILSGNSAIVTALLTDSEVSNLHVVEDYISSNNSNFRLIYEKALDFANGNPLEKDTPAYEELKNEVPKNVQDALQDLIGVKEVWGPSAKPWYERLFRRLLLSSTKENVTSWGAWAYNKLLNLRQYFGAKSLVSRETSNWFVDKFSKKTKKTPS